MSNRKLNKATHQVAATRTSRDGAELVHGHASSTWHRVCFATPLARPLLDPAFRGDFGGAEVRAVTFATGLARLGGLDVSMVLTSYERESPREIQGITAYFERQPRPILRVRDLPRNRAFYWNVTLNSGRKLKRSLQKRREQLARAKPTAQPFYCRLPTDTLCVFGVHHFAAHIVKSAQASGKRSILFLASDTDLDRRYLQAGANNSYGQQAYMCRFAIEHADRIVAQTHLQQRQLLAHFGRECKVIHNPLRMEADTPTPAAAPEFDYVLWVGRADTFSKRADKCFELARKCPAIQFVTILNKRDEATFLQLVRDTPPNVLVVESVPFANMDHYFRHATALINTSDAEGFPNAFLQAGQHGVPVFSLHVNPNEMLTTHGCGRWAAGDLQLLATELSHCWRNRHVKSQMSAAIASYVRLHHDDRDRARELRDFITDLAASDDNRNSA